MLFKQRKPRKFSYKPQNEKAGLDKASSDISSKWQEIRDEKRKGNHSNSVLIKWILALGMIIVIWYILSNYQN